MIEKDTNRILFLNYGEYCEIIYKEYYKELRDKKGIKKAHAAIKIKQEQTKKDKNKTKKLQTEQNQIKKSWFFSGMNLIMFYNISKQLKCFLI